MVKKEKKSKIQGAVNPNLLETAKSKGSKYSSKVSKSKN